MSKYFPPLEQNQFYHIYNRGNNREAIFPENKNYIFFLSQFIKYLGDYLNIYAFCLLKNHFHFLIRVRNFEFLPENLKSIRSGPKMILNPETIISEQFRRFFLSYSKSVIKQEGRTGSLFQKNFQRKLVDSKSYLLDVVKYIHRNPENHRIIKDYKKYPYSSYQPIATGMSNTFIKTNEVIKWFGGMEKFIKQHDEPNADKEICHI